MIKISTLVGDSENLTGNLNSLPLNPRRIFFQSFNFSIRLKMEGGGGSSGGATAGAGVVPESAIEAVNQTLAYLKELKPQLEQMLTLAEPEVLAAMQPLQRAKTMYLLAGATTTLYERNSLSSS